MDAGSSAGFLHVTNGGHTIHGLQAAGVPGRFSIWADPLHEGPVPAVDDGELVEIRRRFLTPSATPPTGAWIGSDPTLDPSNDLREWREIIARHDSYDELVLWFEHDLFDQLNLIQLLSWIHTHVPAGKLVSLVCIGSFPGHPNFKGLGELTPDELGPLLDTRRAVTSAEYDVAQRAWDAYRQPTPDALSAFVGSDTAVLPYLAPALLRLMQEYPWTTDGLGRSERRLLHLASSGPIALVDAFRPMQDGERFYYMTDGSLAETADTLSRLSPPLLSLDVTGPAHGTLRGTVALTETGREVLDGRLDRVATCAIDRWFGGVHLTGGRTSGWRWDDALQRIVPA